MLKLIYSIRVGFTDLYLTMKNEEFVLDSYFLGETKESIDKAIENFYHAYKDDQTELQDALFELNALGDIIEDKLISVAKTYFRGICYADKEHPFAPACLNIYNFKLIYDPSIETDYYVIDEQGSEDYHKGPLLRENLKAKDVMAILGITRQTLSNYVKKGLIKVYTKYEGSHYTYDYNSVMALKTKK